ncbi:sporulation protein SpoOM [Pradoshia eiseniae]|uniref:Sporulation protein SpoOM n=1 Tax=Pradoshia eiseniae TaxID=2064768 RepID=A0A2S7MW59_9BACI|nr:sporulation protein [Pradoshia eiseniae]PQD94013.1 sporulation protein SpoOM [Pradoshia eiseniae]
MLNKMLSSIGIGAAKVDTQLYKTSYTVGEELSGKVIVQGGKTEQQIERLYLSLMVTYEVEQDDKKFTQKAVVEKYQLSEAFLIQPNELKEIPFSFQLPYDVPITKGRTRAWIQTGLDIKNAVDPQDQDYIDINPHPLVLEFLQTVSEIGFRLREVECKKAPASIRKRFPFVQEFEFKPISGEFRSKLDELEAIFYVSQDQIEVLLQIDRRARGFGIFEALGLDESFVRFTYGQGDLSSLNSRLTSLIRQHS